MDRIKVIGWDVEDTLIPKSERESNDGEMVVRANALELLAKPPCVNLNQGVLPVLQASKQGGIPNGVISSFAYQFGINLICASEAREYIDPRLMFFGHKFAWEGMVLDERDYDTVLGEYVKPSTKMFDMFLVRVMGLRGDRIEPSDCLYIGDNEMDEATAKGAGWRYCPIEKVSDILGRL